MNMAFLVGMYNALMPQMWAPPSQDRLMLNCALKTGEFFRGTGVVSANMATCSCVECEMIFIHSTDIVQWSSAQTALEFTIWKDYDSLHAH